MDADQAAGALLQAVQLRQAGVQQALAFFERLKKVEEGRQEIQYHKGLRPAFQAFQHGQHLTAAVGLIDPDPLQRIQPGMHAGPDDERVEREAVIDDPHGTGFRQPADAAQDGRESGAGSDHQQPITSF